MDNVNCFFLVVPTRYVAYTYVSQSGTKNFRSGTNESPILSTLRSLTGTVMYI